MAYRVENCLRETTFNLTIHPKKIRASRDTELSNVGVTVTCFEAGFVRLHSRAIWNRVRLAPNDQCL
jgi:hypothetical protein